MEGMMEGMPRLNEGAGMQGMLRKQTRQLGPAVRRQRLVYKCVCARMRMRTDTDKPFWARTMDADTPYIATRTRAHKET